MKSWSDMTKNSLSCQGKAFFSSSNEILWVRFKVDLDGLSSIHRGEFDPLNRPVHGPLETSSFDHFYGQFYNFKAVHFARTSTISPLDRSVRLRFSWTPMDLPFCPMTVYFTLDPVLTSSWWFLNVSQSQIPGKQMSGNTSQLYRFKSHRFECLGGLDSLNRLSRFEMNYENLNEIDSNYLKVIRQEIF